MPGNVQAFQKSITNELYVLKDRVRDLIGDAHWGEEGRFKEAVLKNVLRKFLPKDLSVASGFILKATGTNDDDNLLSKQLDIIIYDNTLPVLFSEGDLIVTTMSTVRAIVEVKSKIRAGTLHKVITQFEESLASLRSELNEFQESIFTGIFAFDFEGPIASTRIDAALLNSQQIVRHISLGPQYFIKYWRAEDGMSLTPQVVMTHNFYNIYKLRELSFSYFINNLIDQSCGGLDDRYWFSFPIEGTKEQFRIRTVELRG
jgi:hypothetical protein